MHLLCVLSMLVTALLSYHSHAFTVTCNTPVTIQVRVTKELHCNYSIEVFDVIGFYWRIGADIILRLEDGTRRGGSRLGEFNISDDGAMIMNDPQYGDSNLYTFLVVSRSSGNQNANLQVLVTDRGGISLKPLVTLNKVTTAQSTTTQSEQKKRNGLVIAIVVIAITAIIVVVIICIVCWSRRKQKPLGNKRHEPEHLTIDQHLPRLLSEYEKVPQKSQLSFSLILSFDDKVLAEVTKMLEQKICATKAEAKIFLLWEGKYTKENLEAYLDWLVEKFQEHKSDTNLHEGFKNIYFCAMAKELSKDSANETLLSVGNFTQRLQNMLREKQIDECCFIEKLFEAFESKKIEMEDYSKAIWVDGIQDQLYLFMNAAWRLEKTNPGEGKKHWLEIKADPKYFPEDFLRIIDALYDEKILEKEECRVLLFEIIEGEKLKKDFRKQQPNLIEIEKHNEDELINKAFLVFLSNTPDEFYKLTIDLKNTNVLTPEEVFHNLFNARKIDLINSNGYENGVDQLLRHDSINRKFVKWFITKRKEEKLGDLFKEAVYLVLRIIEEEMVTLSDMEDFLARMSHEIRYKTKEMTLQMRRWLVEKKLKGRTVIKVFYWLITNATNESRLKIKHMDKEVKTQIPKNLRSELLNILKMEEVKLSLQEELKAVFDEIKTDIKGARRIKDPQKFARKDEHKEFVNVLHSTGMIDEHLKAELTSFSKEVTPEIADKEPDPEGLCQEEETKEASDVASV